MLDSSYEGVKRLFLLAYDDTEGDNQVSVDSFKKSFLPSKNWKLQHWNDGRNVYDQLINDSIKQYDEVRKVSIGQGDDYTTGCLLDFAYFKNNYRLIAADLSKQKAHSRAIQQIIFTGKIKSKVANTRVIIHYIFEQSKAKLLQFSKGTTVK